MLKYIVKTFLLSLPLYICLTAQSETVLSLDLKEMQLPFGITVQVPANKPKIGLALSGGGARGITQLGILRALEESGIQPDYIVGTSMGSIIGGLYSAGYSLDVLDSIITNAPWAFFFESEETSRKELFVDQKITEDKALFALRLDGLAPIIPTSLNSGQKVANFLNLLSLNAPIHAKNSFDELKYCFKAVCTDLVTGNTVVLNDGSLSQAMRASSSVSFLLAPVKKDSLLLIDGGLVANVPTKIAKQLGADFVIAVNTTSPLRTREELLYPWNIADQIVSIPIRILNEQQLLDTDFLIEPELTNIDNADFSNASELIKEGYEKTLPLLDSLKQIINSLFLSALPNDEFFIKNLETDLIASEFEHELVRRYSSRDSVGSREILYELYQIYSSGDFENVQAKLIRYPERTIIKIFTRENPVILGYKIEGVNLIEEEVLHHTLSALLNKPFNSKKLIDVLLEILRLYRTIGYSLADFERIEFDPSSQMLIIKMSEGVISKILLEGNIKTNDAVILREFPIKAGEYFRYEPIERGLINLRSTNLFDEIEVSIQKNSGENMLIIRVNEKISRVLRFGLRLDNENLTQLSFDIRDENLFGTGTELGAILSGGIRNRTYIIEHRANRIFDTYLNYKLRGFYNFNDINTYKDDITGSEFRFSRSKVGEYRQIFYGGSIGIGAQVEKFGNVIMEGRYQRDEVKNKISYSGSPYKIDIASLRISFSIDSQDKYPYPINGFLINGFYETAQKALGSNLGYSKLYFDYKSHLSLNSVHNISPRFIIGSADETLPLSEQFSIGGQNSFFGLRDHEFRGRQIFLASLEYRLDLPFNLFFDSYFQVRYDIGSIWVEREQIRFKDLRHGIGATLSIDTPIGPTDFSVGRSFIIKKTLPENKISWGPLFFYFTIGYYY